MRTIYKSALFCAIIILLIIGCKEDNNDLTNVDYTFTFSLQNANGRLSSDYSVKSILVSVTDNNGNEIYKLKELKVYNFDGEYISEPISLIPGSYSVTDFLVIDKNQNVVYVTPKSGAPLAYLVENPLPVNFNIIDDQVNKINLEVIDIVDGSPNDFGYNTFSFSIVETFDFLTAVFVYDEVIKNFKLTSANITVTSGEDTLFSKSISDSTNSILLKSGLFEYKISVKKEGFPAWEGDFTEEDLSAYANLPLMIILDQDLYDGLVAWYPFNGNANDLSGNRNHGYVAGATLSKDRKGKLENAYSFDGYDDYIEVKDNSILHFTNQFSLSVWIKMRSTNLYGSKIIDKAIGGTDKGFALDTYDPNMKTGRTIRLQTANPWKYQSSTIIDLNEWYHVVTTFNNGVGKIYINGVLDFEYSGVVEEIFNPAVPLRFGFDTQIMESIDLDDAYDGLIDDIRIYNREISSVEVKKLFTE